MLLLSERATSRLRTVHYSSHLTAKFRLYTCYYFQSGVHPDCVQCTAPVIWLQSLDCTHVITFRAGYIQTAYSALLQSSDYKVWLYTCWLFQSGLHPDRVQCTTPVIWLQSLTVHMLTLSERGTSRLRTVHYSSHLTTKFDCTHVINCTHVITFRAGYIQTAYSALLQSSDYKVKTVHMLTLSERATSRLRTVHYSSHLTTKFDCTHVINCTHVITFRAGYIQTAYSALLQSSDYKVWLYTCYKLYTCHYFQSGLHPDCVQCTTPVIWLQSLDCTYVDSFRAGYIQTAYSALLQSSDYKVWLYTWYYFQSRVHPDCVQCTTPVIWLQSLTVHMLTVHMLTVHNVNCTHVDSFRAGYIQTAYSALLQSSDYKVKTVHMLTVHMLLVT